MTHTIAIRNACPATSCSSECQYLDTWPLGPDATGEAAIRSPHIEHRPLQDGVNLLKARACPSMGQAFWGPLPHGL